MTRVVIVSKLSVIKSKTNMKKFSDWITQYIHPYIYYVYFFLFMCCLHCITNSCVFVGKPIKADKSTCCILKSGLFNGQTSIYTQCLVHSDIIYHFSCIIYWPVLQVPLVLVIQSINKDTKHTK